MYAGHDQLDDMDQIAVHHNWIVSNHNRWANTAPETVRFYPVLRQSRQVVRCLAYIYNAVARQSVDTLWKISTVWRIYLLANGLSIARCIFWSSSFFNTSTSLVTSFFSC
jgi:hypothetical protein